MIMVGLISYITNSNMTQNGKVHKYRYHENRNKNRIALINEKSRGFLVDYKNFKI